MNIMTAATLYPIWFHLPFSKVFQKKNKAYVMAFCFYHLILTQWNLDLMKLLGTGQICSLNEGFVTLHSTNKFPKFANFCLFLQLGGTGKRCCGTKFNSSFFYHIRKYQGKLNLMPQKHLVMVSASIALFPIYLLGTKISIKVE